MSTALQDAIDHTALGWVKPEIDETLRQARIAIEAFAEAPGEVAALQACSEHLHQVAGTLRMLELKAPEMVASEMERLSVALHTGAIPVREEALAALMRGIVQLPDYLERLQGGHRDIPIVLLPLINDLRDARGVDALAQDALPQLLEAPTDAELEHARGSLAGRNRALLDTVAAALKEDLLRVKDALDLHLRGGRTDVGDLQPQAEALDRIAETLGMIGLDGARNVIHAQRRIVHGIASGERAPQPGDLLDVASALLTIDHSLDDQVSRLGHGQAQDATADDPVAQESRKVMGALAREAAANFEEVRGAFVAFVETDWDHAALDAVPRLLGEVAGAMRILELPEPAGYLEALRRYSHNELVIGRQVPGGRALDHLADALAGMEFYLESLQDPLGIRQDMLEKTRHSLEQIACWPLHDERPEEFAELAAPEAAAPVAVEDVASPPVPVPSVAMEASAPLRNAGFDRASNEIDDEIREIFLEEFEEEIANLDALLPQWRLAPEDGEHLKSIRRVFHTLKGSGRLVGAQVLGEFSWHVENMLNRVLDGSRPASPEVFDFVARAHAVLPQLHAALRGESVEVDLATMEAVADRLAAGEDVSLAAVAPVASGPAVSVEASDTDAATVEVDAVLLEILGTEVVGHLDTVDAWLQQARGGDSHANEGLMRAIHTLNGAFAMTEVVPVTAFTAPAEGYVKRLLAAGQPADVAGIGLLSEVVDAVRASINALQQASPARVPLHASLVERMASLRDTLPEAGMPFIPMGSEDDTAEEAERLEAERLEAERLEAERLEAERLEAERLEAERLEAERLEAERLEAERLEEDRLEAERLEAERLEAERLEAESLEAERLEAERLEAERLEAGRLEAERLEAERLEAERLEAERLEAERLEAERLEAERLEAERLEAERLEAERLEAERLEAERAEAERLEAERLEAERLEAERLEAERLEAERLEAERLEAERVEAERIAAARAEAERREAERVAAEKAQAERLEAERRAAEAAATAKAREEAALAALLSAATSAEDPDAPLDISELDVELVDIFVEEGGDLLDHSDGLLAQLRDAPQELEPLVGLQRDLHTLKGGARMAGVMPVGELSHAMEALLEAVVAQRAELGADGVPLLERGFDRLHGMVTRVAARRAIGVPVGLIEEFTARAEAPLATAEVADPDAGMGMPAPRDFAPLELKPLSAPITTDAIADDDDMAVRAPQEQVRIRADLLDRLVNYAGEVAIYRARLEQQLGAFRNTAAEMEQTNLRLRDQLRRLDAETEAQIIARYQREQDTADATFDPLELDRFSTLQQLSRALGESAADLQSLHGSMDELTRQYETLLLQQSRVSSELQEGLMRTRMLPFDSLVPRLRRVIRQAAGETGKQAQMRLEGAQGELDRNVLERMTAPLEHMLRNAIAHGLEAPEARRQAGKPDEGNIRIAVRREGSEVVLQVSDDGAGINRDAVRRRGVERGLLKPDQVIGDGDLDLLIFEPGFSTADEVSRLAGRGVGMDVVASEVRQLGGSIDIDSRPGAGTTFTLRLPQTLAVTQAVFVKIGDTEYAVPIASVRGVGRIGRDEFARADAVYRYGGEDYVLHDLGALVGAPTVKAEGQLQVPLLLVRSGDLRAAVAVDQVIGNREIVVKAGGPQLASVPGIFGATIMGDGRVVVILDVAPLVRRQATLAHVVAPVQPVAEQRRVPLVMVVDDSITMRKVTGRVLERHNFEVATAKDGIDALERMAEVIPDLMLLDIEMPRMDGYELATAMKADARMRDVPIIMITSRTGEKHRQRAIDIGVERYLGKPYQEVELMRNVFELLKVERTGDGSLQ